MKNFTTKNPPGAFYTAAPVKFVLLSVCTFGLFEFYWFYRNWQLYRERTGRRIMPVWRATFAPIWAYSAFKDIGERAQAQGVLRAVHPGVLAAGYILLLLCHKLPDPYDLVALLRLVPLLVANNLARAAGRAASPGFDENRRLGFRGWLIVVIGGLFFALSVAGNFIDGKALLKKYAPASPYEQMMQQITG